MKIAIDYDFTYTADPTMWDSVLKLMLSSGHTVYCVTARPPEHMPEVRTTIGRILGSDNCIGTNLREKRKTVKDVHDIDIDVWIDDTPDAIVANIYNRFIEE